MSSCIRACTRHYAEETTHPANTLEIIKVRNRPAKELLPQIETILSPSGRASVDTISNAIIVSDTSDQRQTDSTLIKDLDIPVPQVTINLRSSKRQPEPVRCLLQAVSAQTRVACEMRTDKFNQNKNLQLTVSSGSSGYLLIGRDIPFTGYWLDICSRYGYSFGWMTEYKRVESGFEVHAVVLGAKVDLLLLPRLSFADRREIRFTEAATRITVPADTWVTVAATDGGISAVAAAILTANGQTNSQAMILQVKARVR